MTLNQSNQNTKSGGVSGVAKLLGDGWDRVVVRVGLGWVGYSGCAGGWDDWWGWVGLSDCGGGLDIVVVLVGMGGFEWLWQWMG